MNNVKNQLILSLFFWSWRKIEGNILPAHTKLRVNTRNFLKAWNCIRALLLCTLSQWSREFVWGNGNWLWWIMIITNCRSYPQFKILLISSPQLKRLFHDPFPLSKNSNYESSFSSSVCLSSNEWNDQISLESRVIVDLQTCKTKYILWFKTDVNPLC